MNGFLMLNKNPCDFRLHVSNYADSNISIESESIINSERRQTNSPVMLFIYRRGSWLLDISNMHY